MSDSDNTNDLLVTPPNLFSVISEDMLEGIQASSIDINLLPGNIDCLGFAVMPAKTLQETHGADNVKKKKPLTSVESNDFLESYRNIEFQENAHQQFLSQGDERTVDVLSDISVISGITSMRQNERFGLKTCSPTYKPLDEFKNNGQNEGVLAEIDNFFDPNLNKWNYKNGDCVQTNKVRSLWPNELQHISDQLARLQSNQQISDDLLSLSDIWGESGCATAIACTTLQKSSFREEKLRRQHLECIVQSLKIRLLEYQQRLSTAVQVDRAKDEALSKAQSDCKSLNTEIMQLRVLAVNLEAGQKRNNSEIIELQKEVKRTANLAKCLQEENHKLKSELLKSSRKIAGDAIIYKQQIEDLVTKLDNCKQSEEFSINELNELKAKIVKLEIQNEELSRHCNALKKDKETYRKKKNVELRQKQTLCIDGLEMKAKTFEERVRRLTENEVKLKKTIEVQQRTLKAYYQEQLEIAVKRKNDEYSDQLKKSENILKTAARKHEHLITERAVKQIELINDKNELELNLLEEKHNEEVELYRIQLANASKKICNLEEKLDMYKTKRSIIAEKLHGIMETQWQKALEILISPNAISEISNDANMNTNVGYEKYFGKENTRDEESKSVESTMNQTKQNTFSNVNGRKNLVEPIDRFQALIELLLSKVPHDFGKLVDSITIAGKSRPDGRLDRSSKRLHNIKPPWRA